VTHGKEQKSQKSGITQDHISVLLNEVFNINICCFIAIYMVAQINNGV